MFSTSWAMKRVYKFLLKRLLGKLLVNEIDLEQLEVQLGAGTLELRDLLLDTNYLNAQVSIHWRYQASLQSSWHSDSLLLSTPTCLVVRSVERADFG